jgi:FKBP-type peptidyl-prolyl cis-trans isomerase FkpA
MVLTVKQTNLYMKRALLLLSLGIVTLFVSCGKQDKGCEPKTPASERAEMVAYCQANGINFTEHSSGILYEIVSPGSGITPTINNLVFAVYTGKLLNGTQFDATANPISFPLSGVIEGWKIGIPLIQKSGRIKMVIPSALAYSCTGSNSIPPNSPLFFDVTLTDVK